jgi:hypothetical protein
MIALTALALISCEDYSTARYRQLQQQSAASYPANPQWTDPAIQQQLQQIQATMGEQATYENMQQFNNQWNSMTPAWQPEQPTVRGIR